METFKKRVTDLLTVSVLFAMLLSLTACGNSGNSSNSGSSDSSGSSTSAASSAESSSQSVEPENEQAEPDGNEDEQAAALTLADGEAKLIYAKDSYAVAAFHGPDGDIGANFCDADGNYVGGMVGYGHPSDGWTLIISREFPDGYDYSGIGVSITDYDAEQTADGTYPTQNYLNIEQMTEDEMEAIGLDFLDGHCCIVGDGMTTYNGNSFGLTFGISWIDDYYFTSFREIEGFADRFSYFAGDGTPLAEYFEGYSTLEITTMINMFDVMLLQDGDTGDKEQNEKMCDELRACEPYLIYTGLDGTEQRFDLLTEQ